MYYDGTKLLNSKDINGNTPEIYICTSNRSAGKTCYWGRYAVNRFKKYDEKFILLYRYVGELDAAASAFFDDLHNLFFPGDEMTSTKKSKGAYYELYLNDNLCGYAVALNSANKIKKISHVFYDVKRIIFDEFMPEDNSYTHDEIIKFQSIHSSVARGGGEQSRYVPVIMISNPVRIDNPYYIAMGITNRLRKDTKILRGVGYVLEAGFNESAAKAQLASGFNGAFVKGGYTSYAAAGEYLIDHTAFIAPPEGKSKYLCNLKYKGDLYGIRLYTTTNIYYVDTSADATFKICIAAALSDHDENTVTITAHSKLLSSLRNFYENGFVRFRNIEAKNAFLTAVCMI